MNIDTFIAKYEGSGLPYAEEVIASLRSGSARITHAPEGTTSSARVLSIYEHRAKHLAGFTTDFARQLHRDVERLCLSLRTMQKKHCDGWSIESDPYFMYSFLEWSGGDFIGAFKSVDDRKLSKEDEIKYWGKEAEAEQVRPANPASRDG